MTKDMIALQEWWIGEVKALTQKVITAEERRKAKLATAAAKMMGEDFRTYNDIQDAYGMGIISERKRDRLVELLEQREPEPDRLFKMKLELLQEVVETARHVIEDQKFGEVDL